MMTRYLLLLLVGAGACYTATHFEQVPVVGLKDCAGLMYVKPLMLRLTGDDGTGKYTLTGGRRPATVAMRSDQKTSWQVEVGVCKNAFDSSKGSYKCEEPTEWYFDQRFTYDPKSPQKLAVPQPGGGQACAAGVRTRP